LTSALVLAPILLFGLFTALLVPVLTRLMRTCAVREIPSDWLENFSVSSYYPMEKLLAEEDFKFLSRQPGFDLSLYRKLRRDRLHIFKQYLNRSIVDFNRLHAAVRAILPYMGEDRSDLVSRLIWLKMRFCFAAIRAEISYRLCLLGIGRLAVHPLISELERMSLQFNRVAAAQANY
jgi:hypothetical protein